MQHCKHLYKIKDKHVLMKLNMQKKTVEKIYPNSKNIVVERRSTHKVFLQCFTSFAAGVNH